MPKLMVFLILSLAPWLAAQAQPVAKASTPHQHLSIDPRMYGIWTLDAAHSAFGGPFPAPTKGQVNWTASGWAFALAFPDGSLYTDAAYTDDGCSLVGVAAPWECSVEVLSPTHVRLIMREGPRVDRVGEIELVDKDTQRAVHRVTPSHGQPYTETMLWKRGNQ